MYVYNFVIWFNYGVKTSITVYNISMYVHKNVFWLIYSTNASVGKIQ